MCRLDAALRLYCLTGGVDRIEAARYYSCKACEVSGVCSVHGDGCMKLRTLVSAGKPNGGPLFSLLGDQKFNSEHNAIEDTEVEKFHRWRLQKGGNKVIED